MLRLPASTVVDKRIGKNKFLPRIEGKPGIKRRFSEQIDLIYWRNKLSPDTFNVAAGQKFPELEVFELVLSGETLDEDVLKALDKAVPYPILFVLKSVKGLQIAIQYKEVKSDSKTHGFKTNSSGFFFLNCLRSQGSFDLRFDGLDVDAIYEGLVRQIAGSRLSFNEETNVKEVIEQSKERATLERKIAALQRKIRGEPQLNRRMELRSQQKELQKKLERILNGKHK